MQLRFQNWHPTEILIDDVCGHIEGLGLQSEFAMDIDYPFEEECTRSVFDFCLDLLKVVYGHHVLGFFLSHSLVDLLGEFYDALGVVELFGILFWHFCLLLFFVLFQSIFEKFLDFATVIAFL